MIREAALVLALWVLAAPAGAMEKPRDWVPPAPETVPNHREQWRLVASELAAYAKARKPDFAVLARGGVELVVKGDREAKWEELQDPTGRFFEKRLPLGSAYRPYLKVIDGVVLDGLFCGPDTFGKPLVDAIKERRTLDRILAEEKARGIQRPPVPQPFGPFSIDPAEELRRAADVRRNAERLERQRRMVYAIDALRESGRRVLSIEDCADAKAVESAFRASDRDRVLTYAGTNLEKLDALPRGHARAENAEPITTITQARNWLMMARGDKFGSKAEWLRSLAGTNHDVVVVDPTWRGADAMTKDEVKRLKFKELGAPRLVLARLPVGRADDARWYWQKGWEAGRPAFLFAPDSETPGTFITDVGDKQWQQALGKLMAWIMDLGFDGVLLDDLDTYLWFEELMPLGL